MINRTPLYPQHVKAHAKLIDFSGWEMPIHYGSQLEEHHYVRQGAGMFDVSHMTVVDVTGEQAESYLQRLLANNVAKLKAPGKALYSCMLNEQGGVVDDLIVYKRGEQYYRLVVNAGTRDKDLAWLQRNASGYNVQLTHQPQLCIIAVQGPEAISRACPLFPAEIQSAIQALRPFEFLECEPYFIARTGYTGEDGLEIIAPTEQAVALWEQLLAADVKPCGLGARDTLRLEAGFNLYGSDMDESTHPLESNLAWTIAWEPESRDFIGRQALEKLRGTQHKRLVGLVLSQKGVLRNHQKVFTVEGEEGEITSGSFSPTLQVAIALARIPATQNEQCFVEIRGQKIPASIVKPQFVRQGKKCVT
ncbi:MAG: glycine cleavage system aminomethyltransferase GcvT [Gammaproteobacteria bacterium]